MFGLGSRPARKLPSYVRNMGQYLGGWREVPYSTGGNMREVRYCLFGPRKPMREYKRFRGKLITSGGRER